MNMSLYVVVMERRIAMLERLIVMELQNILKGNASKVRRPNL
jgi:hypothetical protein